MICTVRVIARVSLSSFYDASGAHPSFHSLKIMSFHLHATFEKMIMFSVRRVFRNFFPLSLVAILVVIFLTLSTCRCQFLVQPSKGPLSRTKPTELGKTHRRQTESDTKQRTRLALSFHLPVLLILVILFGLTLGYVATCYGNRWTTGSGDCPSVEQLPVSFWTVASCSHPACASPLERGKSGSCPI